jgi:hypothetical protein
MSPTLPKVIDIEAGYCSSTIVVFPCVSEVWLLREKCVLGARLSHVFSAWRESLVVQVLWWGVKCGGQKSVGVPTDSWNWEDGEFVLHIKYSVDCCEGARGESEEADVV